MPSKDTPIPIGLCQCGCGGKTTIAKWNDRTYGNVEGQPRRFIQYHHLRARKRSAEQERASVLNPDNYLIDPETDCWNWQRQINAYGYARVWFDGRDQYAAAVFYQLLMGPIPQGMVPDHLCRNRPCVNPNHLEPVTNKVNIRRGARTKLTAQDVADIRASSEKNDVLAERFGVSVSHIKKIRRYETWID